MKQQRLLIFINLLIIIFHSTLFAQSQEDQQNLFEIGVSDSLYSKKLDEYRKIWVHVPESAMDNKNKKYPVLFVLDGDSQLPKISAILQQLERIKLPEMIVIGVDNSSNRLRDLTPTKPHNPSPVSPVPGGGEKFTEFIEDELVPYIDSKYPTTSYRTLWGHSIGGLLVLNVLFSHSDTFDNYIAIDPSLWRGGDYDYLKEYSAYLNNRQFYDKSLFVGVANTMSRLNLNLDTVSVLKDRSRATEHIRHILTFSKIATTNRQNKLNFAWEYYDNEGHNSVVQVSTYDALCYIFRWYPENKK
jgi:predicted alpha/beta superfamily hydrolase